MKLHIEVTREDLDNGLRGHPSCCPIALAIKHACEKENIHFQNVEVEGDSIFLRANDEELYAVRYDDVKFFLFISAYDIEDFVSPFEADIIFTEREYEN